MSNKAGRPFFESLNKLVRKRHRAIVALWFVALVLSAPLVAGFFSSVSFNITNSSSFSVQNSESQRAQAILDAEFPSMNTSSGPIIVVFQSADVYSSEVRSDLFSLNRSLSANPAVTGFTGIASVYTEEETLLDSTIPRYVDQIALAVEGVGNSSERAAAWNASAKELASETSSVFASSPLFTVNSSSLYNLLTEFNATSTPREMQAAISNLVAKESLADCPYVLSSSITRDFVSANGGTMTFELGFSESPANDVIEQTSSSVHDSDLAGLGTIYVTGSPVFAVDFENAASPALDDSIIPGLGISLLVAGLLFLSPIAAVIPLLIGGFAIGISLGSVYGIIVKLQHGQINFAVPFLMILTMLGLSVDYSVLQLRRTKEERSKGKSVEESVSTSVRWAGQAVLTAGLTVVVAYIVLAVTKVPFFGAVGAAIAIGVGILLVASLTLLPSLELMLGDRLFWPRGSAAQPREKPSKGRRLQRVTETTVRRRVAIAAVITLLAAGSFYLVYKTPSSFDLTKLIPNFESNQGLTAITNSLGGSVVSPVLVVVSLPSDIVYGHDQFNQTQLNLIGAITKTISTSDGVVSVSSPTSPYGAPLNYSALDSLPPPVQSQYLTGILSQVGRDNKTALITVGLSASSQSPTAVNDLKSIEAAVGRIPLPARATVYFGGSTQSTIDTLSLVNGVLPLVLLILSLGVYFILFVQLRSVFTPLRLIFTILCSVSFALGLLSIAFFYLLNTPVVSLAPLFVIVTMLGVGVDYDIFLVTRIKEEATSGKSDIDAIKTALDKIWVTLFGLGLILSSVFASLVVSGIGLLQEIGVSVASAIMVDVGVVILFFVPALMAIAQKYNWWPGRVREEQVS